MQFVMQMIACAVACRANQADLLCDENRIANKHIDLRQVHVGRTPAVVRAKFDIMTPHRMIVFGAFDGGEGGSDDRCAIRIAKIHTPVNRAEVDHVGGVAVRCGDECPACQGDRPACEGVGAVRLPDVAATTARAARSRAAAADVLRETAQGDH